MSVRRGRRALTLYRPGTVYFNAGMLVIVTFGMMLAAIGDSYLAQDFIWMSIFTAGAIGCTGLYFWIVLSWLRWMDHSCDFTPVDDAQHRYVSCWQDCGHDHHPGDF